MHYGGFPGYSPLHWPTFRGVARHMAAGAVAQGLRLKSYRRFLEKLSKIRVRLKNSWLGLRLEPALAYVEVPRKGHIGQSTGKLALGREFVTT